MRKILSIAVIILLCATMLSGSVLPTVAANEITNPYGTTSVGCITNIEMVTYQNMGGVDYFKSVVTSHVQGLEARPAISYDVYGGIGSENSKLFVYSMGNDADSHYSNRTVKAIVEKFEAENPDWDAQVAINGDFFDIETKNTPDLGEPEGPMIQNGDILKAHLSDCLGRGIVGVKDNGTMVYHATGGVYSQSGYGISYPSTDYHVLSVIDDATGEVKEDFNAYADRPQYLEQMYFVTEDSSPANLTGRKVCVLKYDTYRRAHIGINGADIGTRGYFFEGKITQVRDGKANEKPEAGQILIATPINDTLALEKGYTVKCQKGLNKVWDGVDNAIGFKQLILAKNKILLKNAYGTYNTSGDRENTLRYTDDVYDYPYCWKNRTAIGFKKDGTPIVLVLKKAAKTGDGDLSGIGVSYYEIGEQLKAMGCYNGFLLDGGGSSTFVIRKADGTFETAFSGENGGDGRRVANAVILAVRDPATLPPETDAPTEAPTDAPTDVTDVSNIDAVSGGCGSAIIMTPITLCTVGIATFATVSNKKKSHKKKNK